jgi:hypothetical protein
MTRLRAWHLLVVGLVPGAGPLAAQNACMAPAGSNEADIMGTKSAAIAFTPTRGPARMPAGRVELGLGILSVPGVDQETQDPTFCGVGQSLSNTNQLPVAVQPRVRVGLGRGFAADAGWVPPIPVSGITANILGLGADWTSPTFAHLLTADVALNAAFGSVQGSFTCNEEEVKDPTNFCYLGAPSDDSFKPAVYGADVTLGASLDHGALRPYVGAGYTRLMPRFQVDYTNAAGVVDNTRVESNLNVAAVFGGLTWDPARHWSFTGQVYALVSYGVSASLTTRYALGK